MIIQGLGFANMDYVPPQLIISGISEFENNSVMNEIQNNSDNLFSQNKEPEQPEMPTKKDTKLFWGIVALLAMEYL